MASPEKPKTGTEKMLISFILLAVLSLGCVWSVLQFQKIREIIAGEYSPMPDIPAPPSDAEAKQEMKSVKETRVALLSVGESKKQAMQSALLAETTGVFPIANGETLFAGSLSISVGDVDEEFPPVITVRAVMTLGKTSIATIDIADEMQGKIVQTGSTFDGKNGRVLSINSGGVKYRWKNKVYEARINP